MPISSQPLTDSTCVLLIFKIFLESQLTSSFFGFIKHWNGIVTQAHEQKNISFSELAREIKKIKQEGWLKYTLRFPAWWGIFQGTQREVEIEMIFGWC